MGYLYLQADAACTEQSSYQMVPPALHCIMTERKRPLCRLLVVVHHIELLSVHRLSIYFDNLRISLPADGNIANDSGNKR